MSIIFINTVPPCSPIEQSETESRIKQINSKCWLAHHRNLHQIWAYQAGKSVFKVNAADISQECDICVHTHSDNHKNQSVFKGVNGNHSDNADRNVLLIFLFSENKLLLIGD